VFVDNSIFCPLYPHGISYPHCYPQPNFVDLVDNYIKSYKKGRYIVDKSTWLWYCFIFPTFMV